MRYVITITIGPHDKASELDDYMVGEISAAINRCDLQGVPVTWETSTEPGFEQVIILPPIPGGPWDDSDDAAVEDFDEIFFEGDR